jgi:hypothetical protein
MLFAVRKRALGVCVLACTPGLFAHAAPVTPARVAELCAQAESPSHCGRLIEAEQLKSLPNLAVRDGATLKVSLYPAGARDFIDTESPTTATTWSLWDYWSPVNVVVLFTTDGDRLGFALLQRTSGQLTAIPAEPSLSPDRQRLAIADFCRANCDSEVTVWRIARDGIRKEYGWKPAAVWSDVTVKWKDAETLVIEFTPNDTVAPQTIERRLGDAGWQRATSRPAQ